MNELEQYIDSYFGIQQENLQQLASMFNSEELKKDDYFTETGKYNVPLSFIRSGFIRIHNYKEGKEITQWISAKGDFITDLSALVFNNPSRWNMQAITDCELYTISREDYLKIGLKIPQWDKIEKLFIAKCFVYLEERVYSFLSMTAEERYKLMHERNKDLIYQVPQQYLASMLGITPETFSRIRRKLVS